jgi:hypothetical protein
MPAGKNPMGFTASVLYLEILLQKKMIIYHK